MVHETKNKTLSIMKKAQLSTLAKGTKFYFGENENLICTVAFNSGKTMRVDGPGKQTIYGKMPSVCVGNLVTIL
jgi:alpha-D-ribose 1-methylphosphonate 5-triphosphate synthase subunit PhnH